MAREPTPGPPPFADMAWIPGGTFLMGSDHHYPEEAPAHTVTVEGFWMDAHTVRGESGTKLRPAAARDQCPAESDERRVISVCTQLLPALPPSGAHGPTGRYLNLSPRVSLYR
jgi:Sulfatase-modifying factor enzyme 1